MPEIIGNCMWCKKEVTREDCGQPHTQISCLKCDQELLGKAEYRLREERDKNLGCPACGALRPMHMQGTQFFYVCVREGCKKNGEKKLIGAFKDE